MCHLMPSWPVFLRQAAAAFVCKWPDDQWLIVVCDALAARSAISPPRGRHAERPTTGRGEDYCLCVLQARCRPHERRFCLGARLELALDAPPWLAACLSPPRHLLFVSNGNHTNSQGEDNGGDCCSFYRQTIAPAMARPRRQCTSFVCLSHRCLHLPPVLTEPAMALQSCGMGGGLVRLFPTVSLLHRDETTGELPQLLLLA